MGRFTTMMTAGTPGSQPAYLQAPFLQVPPGHLLPSRTVLETHAPVETGGTCNAGACTVACKTAIECPAGCVCGEGQCVANPTPATSYKLASSFDLRIGAFHGFRKEWWMVKTPAKAQICRFDGAKGQPIGCFDPKVTHPYQLWGESTGDYAYVAWSKSVRKWKGTADKVLWTYSLPGNSLATIRGVCTDSTSVLVTPTWGPTNIERIHRLSGKWMSSLKHGMKIGFGRGIIVAKGVVYIAWGGGGVKMLDMGSWTSVIGIKSENAGMMLRDDKVCLTSGQVGDYAIKCWKVGTACPLP